MDSDGTFKVAGNVAVGEKATARGSVSKDQHSKIMVALRKSTTLMCIGGWGKVREASSKKIIRDKTLGIKNTSPTLMLQPVAVKAPLCCAVMPRLVFSEMLLSITVT